MQRNRNWFFHIGNGFIAASLLGFIFLFYPIIMLYLFPIQIKQTEVVSKEYALLVPRIQAYSPIVKDVDPWDAQEYLKALKKGVAQAKGTSLPGNGGSIYIFAHSSGNPFVVNRYNTVFYRLDELTTKDRIYIRHEGIEYEYKVTDKKVVWPSEVRYLVEAQKNVQNQLILQTCTPIGTSLKRLLVFASPVVEN